MSGQVPTEEVVRVCRQLMELAKDYLLLSRMNGVENIDDIFLWWKWGYLKAKIEAAAWRVF